MRAGEVFIMFPLYTQPQYNKYLLTNERTTQHQLAAIVHLGLSFEKFTLLKIGTTYTFSNLEFSHITVRF